MSRQNGRSRAAKGVQDKKSMKNNCFFARFRQPRQPRRPRRPGDPKNQNKIGRPKHCHFYVTSIHWNAFFGPDQPDGLPEGSLRRLRELSGGASGYPRKRQGAQDPAFSQGKCMPAAQDPAFSDGKCMPRKHQDASGRPGPCIFPGKMRACGPGRPGPCMPAVELELLASPRPSPPASLNFF